MSPDTVVRKVRLYIIKIFKLYIINIVMNKDDELFMQND